MSDDDLPDVTAVAISAQFLRDLDTLIATAVLMRLHSEGIIDLPESDATERLRELWSEADRGIADATSLD